MTIKPWFPTLIYEARLERGGDTSLRRALLEDSYKVRAHDRAGRRWCEKNYPAGYTSYASLSHLHRTFSTFMDLEKKIRPHVLRFARRQIEGPAHHRQRVFYDVEPGKLILFESWLRHEVAPNPTRGDRVSVSFNYDWV